MIRKRNALRECLPPMIPDIIGARDVEEADGAERKAANPGLMPCS